MRGKIFRFYLAALSCLLMAEVYFVSGWFTFSKCTQNFLQTYPGFAYLLAGYTYIVKSLEV